MPSLQQVLASIPFVGGYEAAREQEQTQSLDRLRRMGALSTLQAQLEARQREQSFRTDLGNLGPAATQDDLARVAARYASPASVLQSQTASADRKTQIQAMAEQRKATLAQQQSNAEMVHEYRMGRLTNEGDRGAETARHNKVMEGINAQNTALNAQLRAMGIDLQKMGLQMQADKFSQARKDTEDKNVQQLGTALERANLPEADSVLRGVEKALENTPELASYLSGPRSALPDVVVPQNVREGRQAFQKLFNITLKDRSGAAVTIPEFERLKKEFGTGIWKTAEQLKAGVTQARKVVADHYRGIATGFNPDVMRRYNENLRTYGGSPLLETDKEDPLGIR